MSKVLLSICIAAYNSKSYISNMLDSMLKSSFRDELELIVVDDGSTDGTGDIIDGYAYKYPDIVVAKHQKNSGSGGAWNTAFKCATGRYVKIIDSDDMVDTENFDKYLDKISSIDCDMIINPHFIFYMQTGTKELANEVYRCDTKGSLSDFIKHQNISMHDVTYKNTKNILGDLAFIENVSYGDMEYLTVPVPRVTSVQYINTPFYIYCLGIEGQSISPEVSVKKNMQRLQVAGKIVEYRNSTSCSEEAQNWIDNQLIRMFNCSVIDYCNVNSFAYRLDIKKADMFIKVLDKRLYGRMNEVKLIKWLRRTNYYFYYFLVLAKYIKRCLIR